VDFGPYMRQTMQSIGKAWSSSPVQRGPRAETAIRFTIQADGTVRNMVLVESSHLTDIDRAVWGSIIGLGRFAPLPAGFTGPDLTLEVKFK
jgi:TonB family protein